MAEAPAALGRGWHRKIPEFPVTLTDEPGC